MGDMDIVIPADTVVHIGGTPIRLLHPITVSTAAGNVVEIAEYLDARRIRVSYTDSAEPHCQTLGV